MHSLNKAYQMYAHQTLSCSSLCYAQRHVPDLHLQDTARDEQERAHRHSSGLRPGRICCLFECLKCSSYLGVQHLAHGCILCLTETKGNYYA